MLAVALFSLGFSQCTPDEVEAIMAAYNDLTEEYDEDNATGGCLTTPTDNGGCYVEDADRRRAEANFDEMPEAGTIYTTFQCYCTTCSEQLAAQAAACASCPAMTFVYDEDDDEDKDDRTYNLGEWSYATYCTLNGILPLEKSDNFCSVFNGGVSESCATGTENLNFVTVEVTDDNGNVEDQAQDEALKECWSSPFQSTGDAALQDCGDVCTLVSSQTCGVELLSESDVVPNGIGAYGVGCFANECSESDAEKILEVVKDLYQYAQFLQSIEMDEERDDKDSNADDGLDLPEFSQASWKCNGDAGSGSDTSGWQKALQNFGSGETLAVIFGFLFLFTCIACLYYYKYTKTLLEEPFCPPWSKNDAHERLTDAGDEKNYGGTTNEKTAGKENVTV